MENDGSYEAIKKRLRVASMLIDAGDYAQADAYIRDTKRVTRHDLTQHMGELRMLKLLRKGGSRRAPAPQLDAKPVRLTIAQRSALSIMRNGGETGSHFADAAEKTVLAQLVKRGLATSEAWLAPHDARKGFARGVQEVRGHITPAGLAALIASEQ